MDGLPLEIQCKIVSYLDTSQLLVCRLVSRYWEEIVSCHLARVNHVILNQTLVHYSPIPDILFDDLYSMRFTCGEDSHELFFDFLRKKCPNLKVFSAANDRVEYSDFILLPPGLMYFDTQLKWGRELFFPFSSLIASPYGFCTACRLPSSVQDSSTCCDHLLRSDHPDVNTFTTDKLNSLRWFEDYRSDSNLPVCPSLEILLNYRPKPFSYPKLKFLITNDSVVTSEPFLHSIRHSTQLRAIRLEVKSNAATFLEFAASLEHLQFLHITIFFLPTKDFTLHLNESLEYLYFVSNPTSLSLSCTNHSKLRSFFVWCRFDEPLSFDFPFLQEADIFLFNDSIPDKIIGSLIDSLYHSRKLSRFALQFSSSPTLTCAQTRKVFKFISDAHSLESVSFRTQLEDCDEQFVLDISRHHYLNSVVLGVGSTMVPPNTKVVIGQQYDQLFTDSISFVLKKRGITYRSCHLSLKVKNTTLAPVLANGLSFTKLEMKLPTSQNETRLFCDLTSNMPKLKDLTLSTVDGLNVSLESASVFLESIKRIPYLESLRLDLCIKLPEIRGSNEKMVIDVRALRSLRKVNVHLQSDGDEPLCLQLSLLLGDFFEQLVLNDKSLWGQLVNGESFEATLPTFAEIQFSKPTSQLKSLTVSSWSLIKDKSAFWETCESIESLHVNTGHQSHQINSSQGVVKRPECTGHLHRMMPIVRHFALFPESV